MNTNIKQVTELQVGDFTLELDEERLIALCDVKKDYRQLMTLGIKRKEVAHG